MLLERYRATLSAVHWPSHSSTRDLHPAAATRHGLSARYGLHATSARKP